jgi:hypothetical protein
VSTVPLAPFGENPARWGALARQSRLPTCASFPLSPIPTRSPFVPLYIMLGYLPPILQQEVSKDK